MRIHKRCLAALLACAAALSLSVMVLAAAEDTGFSDVAAGAWYAEAAAYVRDNGIMNGTSATAFDPDETMTRSMLAAVLYRAAGSPAVTGADRFTDTESGAYYANAVVWASENGIVSGYGNGLFGTNDPVSREQIATILWRYDGGETGAASASFTDSAAIGGYAVEAVNWAVENGIVTGLSDGSFGPKASATRAQVAVMLYRYLTREAQAQDPEETPGADSRILIAYFSRAGENWEVGNVEKGNTQIIAEMIADWTGGALFHIETAEPYPEDYMETVRQAQAEQDAGARPELAANVENWDDYDTIFLGYPIWGGDMPMAVYTFIESHDWAGKNVVPFNTHGGSGQSGTVSRIRSACAGAEVQSGIAITGTTAQNDRERAEQTVQQWLEEGGFDDVRAQRPSIDNADAERQVAAAYRARCDAMVRGDTDELDRLLSDDLVLRHITGATQTKEEWLDDVAAERMKYYNIDIQDCAVTVDGDRAECRHTSVIDARINGSRGTWTLSGTSYYENQDGQWIAVNGPEG